MALVGYEWLIVIAVILIVVVWGPSKILEFAKSLGSAKKELKHSLSTAKDETSQDPLITAAKSMGIDTEGKTKEQIANDIANKTSKRPTS
jgi:sec-independent protein translocase protein TatA